MMRSTGYLALSDFKNFCCAHTSKPKEHPLKVLSNLEKAFAIYRGSKADIRRWLEALTMRLTGHLTFTEFDKIDIACASDHNEHSLKFVAILQIAFTIYSVSKLAFGGGARCRQ